MRRGEAHVIHQGGGVVRQHRDAVVDIRFLAQPGAALIEGEHAKVGGANGCEVGEHALIALRAMNHDQRRAVSGKRISKLDPVDARPFHTRSAFALRQQIQHRTIYHGWTEQASKAVVAEFI